MGTSIEWDHAALMDHFLAEQNISRALNDFVSVTVNNRISAQKTTSDTAVIDVEVFGGLGVAAPFTGQTAPAIRSRRRFSASGVSAGSLPFSGSTMSEA